MVDVDASLGFRGAGVGSGRCGILVACGCYGLAWMVCRASRGLECCVFVCGDSKDRLVCAEVDGGQHV